MLRVLHAPPKGDKHTSMPGILLCTLNARYTHASFGLRYLMANMQELEPQTGILEFTISQRPADIAEKILERNPGILGLGVYIWNISQSLQLVRILKKIRPELVIILGGPEVSYEYREQEIVKLADYTITGEADLTFRNLCAQILSGVRPETRVINSPVPKPEQIKLPYRLYNDEDAANRVIYVEASRGCPFTCEFCLSSIDIPVRQFETDELLREFKTLIDKGVRQFKFVDRTFNLNFRTGKKILDFFLDNYVPGMFVHFEMVPDRLPDLLKDAIRKFPAGVLQFEVGIQSFNPETGKLISRRQDYNKIGENIKFLRAETGVHIHADLIAGLPGEDMQSFAEGFDRLVAMDPQEIQVGILKRLKGTPIIRHDREWQMVYSEDPPYELLSNKLVSFEEMQEIGRFSRYWDICANSGHFRDTLPLLWKDSGRPFDGFMEFSRWLFNTTGQRHAIALQKLTNYVAEYLLGVKAIDRDLLSLCLAADIQRTGGRDLPKFLSTSPSVRNRSVSPEDLSRGESLLPKRQSRHAVQQ